MNDELRRGFLILRAQSGDKAAYGELLGGVEARLLRYVEGITRDRALAEDTLQEIFVIVYRKLAWLKDPALFWPWLYRVATREAFRALKKRRRFVEIPLDEEAEGALAEPPPELRDPRVLARLPELVGDIPPASRVVLILHYGEEMRLEEVALALGLPLGTVKSRLSYGLAALRRRLGLTAPERR
jgi:RNA polymerase sigma-70 factor, ECF subfamily